MLDGFSLELHQEVVQERRLNAHTATAGEWRYPTSPPVEMSWLQSAAEWLTLNILLLVREGGGSETNIRDPAPFLRSDMREVSCSADEVPSSM
jgi:hypothetical protein